MEIDITKLERGVESKLEGYLKNICIWVLVLTMILPSPMIVFGQENKGYKYTYNNLSKDKAKIINEKLVNLADVTTITASFKQIDAVSKEAKPGYVKVEFIIDPYKGGGRIASGETSVYYVDPNRKVTLTPPSTLAVVGYEFEKWNPDPTEERQYQSPIQITGSFKTLPSIIPSNKDQSKPNTKPDGYITVEFVKGDHGEFEGETVYYVNPKKVAKLNQITKPKVKVHIGYQHIGWNMDDDYRFIRGTTYISSMAKYKAYDDVVPKDKPTGGENTKPNGYITVTFKTTDKAGSLEKVVYINPNKAVELTSYAPEVNPITGYEFTGWNRPVQENSQYSDGDVITAQFNEIDNVSKVAKPGYVKVEFKPGDHGSLKGDLNLWIKPGVDVTVPTPDVNPSVGYKFKEWDKKLKVKLAENSETYVITAGYEEIGDIIPQEKTDGSDRPKGYYTVKLIPTNKATDATNKVYFVNPTKEVTIANTPVGTESTDANGITYKYTFTGWTVTRGTINSWNSGTITGKFTQDTDITGQYSTKVGIGELIPAPIAKDEVVTGKGDVPKAENLIKNIPGSQNAPLPDGTTFRYTDNGKPNVDNPGKTTAKVEVKYPNGKTIVVEVPITVVDNVVPQTGNDKPLVPDTYVKVTVDTTGKATDNSKFEKIFWVKPNVEVSIPGIQDPTGKPETDANGVTNTNNFKKWKLEGSNPEKTYDHGTDIKGTFTAKESTIVATYEQDKNVEPVGNNGLDVPKGSTPSAKDFIKNVYDDSDPSKKDNLPPGTKFEFANGNPDTSTPGTNKTTKIKVTYPNGETKTVDVTYNVTEDVVEQTNPNKKPDVPERFVKVTVKTTDKATNATAFERVFWVDPTKEVTIPVGDPVGKVGPDDQGKTVQWQFTGWDKPLKGKFTNPETTITAQYEPASSVPGSVGYLVTEEGVQPTPDQYKNKITPPTGKTIGKVEIIRRPDVSKPGVSTADLKVTYTDGTSSDVKMTVFVQRKPQTDWQTGTLGPTRTRTVTVVEKEIVKVPAEKTFRKEVRYMQGYNNYFRPGAGLTRAEAAQILANALVEDGYRYDPNLAIHYKDIVGNEWYAKAIRITSQANVFKGYDTGYFDPHKKITRAEWIGTLRRFQELERVSGNHMQVRADHWAMGEIEAAYKEGWLAIYGQGLAKFKADEFIPRQEVAAVSNKAFNRVLDKTYIHRNSKNLINYKDVSPSLWSYEDILCASNGFIHDDKSFWGHKVDYKKDLYNINLDGYTVTKDKFQRLERR